MLISGLKNINKYIRLFLGIAIAFSGLNKFGHWINVSFMHDALEFIGNLISIKGGFIVTTIAVVEITIGAALIFNRFKLLAVLALFPLMVSILLFHIFLDLKGIGIALFVLALDLYLIVAYREKVAVLFKPD